MATVEVLKKKKEDCEKKFNELKGKLVEIDNARKTVEEELFRLQGEHRGYDALIAAATDDNGSGTGTGAKILDAKIRVSEGV